MSRSTLMNAINKIESCEKTLPDVDKEYLLGCRKSVEERLGDVNAVIDRFMGYGASWALDCREMRIAQARREALWMELSDINDAIELASGMDPIVKCWEHLIGEEIV